MLGDQSVARSLRCQGCARVGLEHHPGQRRTDTVVQVAPQPAPSSSRAATRPSVTPVGTERAVACTATAIGAASSSSTARSGGPRRPCPCRADDELAVPAPSYFRSMVCRGGCGPVGGRLEVPSLTAAKAAGARRTPPRHAAAVGPMRSSAPPPVMPRRRVAPVAVEARGPPSAVAVPWAGFKATATTRSPPPRSQADPGATTHRPGREGRVEATPPGELAVEQRAGDDEPDVKPVTQDRDGDRDRDERQHQQAQRGTGPEHPQRTSERRRRQARAARAADGAPGRRPAGTARPAT